MSPASPHPAPPAATPADIAPWLHAYALLPPDDLRALSTLVARHAASLAATFYSALMQDDEARPSLSHTLVDQRLRPALARWLTQVFADTPAPDVAAVIQTQRQVGTIHARVGVPMKLVSRGARILKARLVELLREEPLDRLTLSLSQQVLDTLFDLALEQMGEAFRSGSDRGIRSDEAYRLLSLGHNIVAERERQRATLMEWGQAVLLALHRARPDTPLPAIGQSDFGLWMSHKAATLFDGAQDLARIQATMRQLDQQTLPALAAPNDGGAADPMAAFQDAINEIKYLLGNLFDVAAELENGRDTVTRLLSRKFVAPICRREISLAMQTGERFAVLMVDVDFFKAVNDRFGHAGGDRILQQIADLLLGRSRPSDFVFRYGGEEFLVILVNVTAEQAAKVAGQLRTHIEQYLFKPTNNDQVALTASFGVAAFDGHPDYEHLLRRADQALYLAKQNGRNRVETAA